MRLLLRGGDFEPVLQDGQVLGLHIEEDNACAHIGLGVDDSAFRLENHFVGPNLQEHERVLWEGIHHVQVTPVQAQFADPRSDAHFRFLFKELGAGEEHIPRRAAAFPFHWPSLTGTFIFFYPSPVPCRNAARLPRAPLSDRLALPRWRLITSLDSRLPESLWPGPTFSRPHSFRLQFVTSSIALGDFEVAE